MPAFVVGDVHGHRDALVGLLRDAGLIDGTEHWCGTDARLWLVGDLVDRGPDGIGAIDLVMELERQGDVRCLLGNHEVMLLAADRFWGEPVEGTDATFGELWSVNGGQRSDLARLDDDRRAWLRARPPAGREGLWLVLHADTDRYLELGRTADELARSSRAILDADDPRDVARLFGVVADRGRLAEPAALERLRTALGGERVVHGHTPIPFVLGRDPSEVTAPLAYAGGRVLNVDHCLFGGGPGFVVEL